MFQMVKVWLWHWRNFYPRNSSWVRSTNREWQSKSSCGIEDLYQDKRSRKLLRICKLLPKIYQELESYGQISQWTQRKKRMEIGKRISRSIQRIKGKDHKSTSTHSSKKKRKILSRNRCFRTCYRRSSITRARRKMETYCIFVKNKAICRKKLWDL